MSEVLLDRGTSVTATRPRLRKSHLYAGAAVLLAAGIAWYGADWWQTGRFIQSTDDAYVGGDITVIAPKVAGFIDQVAVTDNQLVHAGDVLVRLDDRDYRVALASAAAKVVAAQAALDHLDASAALQQSLIAEAAAGLAAAQANLHWAQQNDQRYRDLSAQKAASVEIFQRTDADYRTAVAGLAHAEAELQAARQQLSVIAAQKSEAQAALAEQQSARDAAALDLSRTILRAPIDGMVGNRSAQQGAYATAGAQLISLVPAHGLWVDANFKEDQLAHMRPGEPVTIIADAAPDTSITGHVVSVSPATGAEFSLLPAENATGNFTKIVQRVPVRIALDGAASELGLLRPGLSVTARVDAR